MLLSRMDNETSHETADDSGEDLLTVPQIAALRGTSLATVYSWVRDGRLFPAADGVSARSRGPRRIAVYRRADALAVETPGRGRRPDRSPLERRPDPPPGPYASEADAIRAIRMCFPRLLEPIAAASLRASGGDVERACDLIWLSRRGRR